MTDAEEHELREQIKDLIDQRRMTDEELTRERVLGEFFISVVVHSDDQITIEKPDFDIGAMADEIVRLRRILDALREPSEAVVQAVFLTVFEDEPAFEDQCRKAAADAIRAAVAAAEQEVSNDAR